MVDAGEQEGEYETGIGSELYLAPADGVQHPGILGYLFPVGCCPFYMAD